MSAKRMRRRRTHREESGETVPGVRPRGPRAPRRAVLAALAAALLLGAPVARADHRRVAPPGRSVRVLPLRDVLARLRERYAGQVLEAELERGGRGQWIYEIKFLTPRGDVLKFDMDAGSARILRIRGRGAKAARRRRAR